MSRRVSWFLFCSLLSLARTQNECLPSREVYVNRSLGDPEDIALNFVVGSGLTICPVGALSCCSNAVESSFFTDAVRDVKSLLPNYPGYLNVSESNLFPHYGYVTNIVIEAIRDYFELSVPANNTNIRGTLNRVVRQLTEMHTSNGGGSFRTRMRQLFSNAYLERMSGLYNDSYSNTFTRCAQPIIEQTRIPSEISDAMDIMEQQFRALYQVQELFFSIHILFFQLEDNLPFQNCLNSFTQLFYCQICQPETSRLFPCRNVCKNVLSGCTIFLQVVGEQLANPLRALCQLNTITTDASWSLHSALETINNELYSIFDIPEEVLLQIASNISSCEEAPSFASNPSPTDNPARVVLRREQLFYIPTSLIDYLYYTLVTNLSSVFIDFENSTQRILESVCGGFPGNNGSIDFECWHRDQSSVDVQLLELDFDTVLNGNSDLAPPDATFISNFNSSVMYMNSNATEASRFISSIPANMRVNTDRCNTPLSQMVPPTFTVAPTTHESLGTIPTIPTLPSPTPGGSAKWTQFNAILLLLPAILLFILVH